MYLWCPGKHDPILYPASKPLWWFWIFPNASELVDTWDYQSTFIYIYIYLIGKAERERERERLLGRFHLCDWSMFWWKRITAIKGLDDICRLYMLPPLFMDQCLLLDILANMTHWQTWTMHWASKPLRRFWILPNASELVDTWHY